MSKTAIVLGATGLIGSQLVPLLLADPSYGRVKVFGRRSLGLEDPKLDERLVSFELPLPWAAELEGDVLFSTLGTTRRQAGSKAAQWRVDYDYQLAVAEGCRVAGVQTCVLVSSVGASPSALGFYPRMKGQLERAVARLSFAHLAILQPSLLVGERLERRPGEELAAPFTNALTQIVPGLGRYRPVRGETVASAMVQAAEHSPPPALLRYVGAQIMALAEARPRS